MREKKEWDGKRNGSAIGGRSGGLSMAGGKWKRADGRTDEYLNLISRKGQNLGSPHKGLN